MTEAAWLASAIALLAAAIALGQLQANRAKLAIDLFDRRFELFMRVRSMVSEAVAHAKLKNSGLPNEVLAQGRYLFDRDIEQDLKDLHNLMIGLETGKTDAVVRIQEKFEEMVDAFEPYLRMPHKMPSWF